MSLSLFRIEARRNVGLLLFPVLMVVAWVVAQSYLPDLASTWSGSSVAARNTIMFIAPMIGGVAAWMARREHSRRIGDLLATTAYPEAHRKLILWAATAFWGVLAYVLITVYVLGLTALKATWGSPVLWPVIVGLLAIPAYAALGCMFGYLIHSRLTAPLVGIGIITAQIFVGWMASTSGTLQTVYSHLSFLSPTATVEDSVWYGGGVYPQVGLQQSIFLIGLVGLGLGIIAVKARRSIGSWGLLLSGIALTVFGVVAIATLPAQVTNWKSIPYTPVCEGHPIPLCVHPAYKAELRVLVPMVEKMTTPLAGVPGIPSKFEQGMSTTAGFGDARSVLPRDVNAVWVYPQANGWDQFTLNIMANGLVSTNGYDLDEAQSTVKVWLLSRVDVKVGCDSKGSGQTYSSNFTPAECQAADHFASLSKAERHKWLVKHYKTLREGRLTLEDIP